MAGQLQPYPSPLGFFSHFHVQPPGATLEIKEKSISLSGDSFDICVVHPDGQRVPIFKVKGEAMSLSGRKHVSDMQGNHLFDLRKEHISLRTTYYAEDGAGNKFLEVVSKFSSKLTSPDPFSFSNPRKSLPTRDDFQQDCTGQTDTSVS